MLMLFAAALLATQEAPAATPAPAQTVEKPRAEKKVCRKVETTSSRMPKRVCKTEVDWANEDKGVNAADLQRMGAR